MMHKIINNVDEITVFLVALIFGLVFLPIWLYFLINTALTLRCLQTNGFPSARPLLAAMLCIGIPTYAAVMFENIKSGVKWHDSL